MALGFTTYQVAKLSGVPVLMLRYWARSGLLRPSLVSADDEVAPALYSFYDLVRAHVARELVLGGFSARVLRQVVGYLGQWDGIDAAPPGTVLVADGYRVAECREADLGAVLRRPGQGALLCVVDLQRIVREVESKVAAIQVA